MCTRSDNAERHGETTGFVDVGPLSDFPPGTAAQVAVGADRFALVHLDDRLLAVRDLCLRCGRPLSHGAVDADSLTCPSCGWKYDLAHGCVEGLPGLRIEVHDVVVDDGRLLLASAIAVSSDPQP